MLYCQCPDKGDQQCSLLTAVYLWLAICIFGHNNDTDLSTSPVY